MEEGYIKFNCNWIKTPPGSPYELSSLNEWRDKLFKLGLIGAYSNGIGFGNISIRKSSSGQFMITGSATGGFGSLSEAHYTTVLEYSLEKNSLTCKGPIQASSESLTHAAIYQSAPGVNAVIHVHQLYLWEKLFDKIPTSNPSVEYGTPEMAHEVIRLFKETAVATTGIFVMGGHKEGIVSFGRDLTEAGEILFRNGLAVCLRQL